MIKMGKWCFSVVVNRFNGNKGLKFGIGDFVCYLCRQKESSQISHFLRAVPHRYDNHISGSPPSNYAQG